MINSNWFFKVNVRNHVYECCWKSVFRVLTALKTSLLAITFSLLTLNVCFAQDTGENASNPLAAVSNLDLRVKTFDLGDGDRDEFYLDGANMLTPKLKFKYEAHWWSTDITGQDENDWESALLKLIYFPKEGKFQSGRSYRVAVGLEWIMDLGDQDKGIGSGADQLGPFVGLAVGVKPGLMLIPLLQHNESYSGEDLSLTAARLIALQTLSNNKWLKMDLKVPYDWENETWPASVELQLGKSLTPKFGVYLDAQSGIGGDKSYDSAFGIGLRFNY